MPGGINSQIPHVKPGDLPRCHDYNDMTDVFSQLTQRGMGAAGYSMINGAGRFFGSEEPDPGILVYNGAGSDMPAYGVGLLDGDQTVDEGDCPKVKQPDTYGCQNNVFVNGGSPITEAGFGYAQFFGRPLIAAYDSADGTPASGDRWRPRSGTPPSSRGRGRGRAQAQAGSGGGATGRRGGPGEGR